jgi:hypothetical protein
MFPKLINGLKQRRIMPDDPARMFWTRHCPQIQAAARARCAGHAG